MKLVKFTSALLCAYASAATIFADGFTHQASDESSTWSQPDGGVVFGALLLLATLVGIGAIAVFANKDRRKNRAKSDVNDRPMAE